MKLLIADDEVQIRTGLAESIAWADLGISEVLTAKDGIEAVEVVKKNRPQIIIADIRMPGIDGLELAQQAINLASSKIIIISGHSDFTYAQQAIKIGVYDYLLKPINIPELIDIIKKSVNEIKLETDLSRRSKELKIIDYVKKGTKVNGTFISDIQKAFQLSSKSKIVCLAIQHPVDINDSWLKQINGYIVGKGETTFVVCQTDINKSKAALVSKMKELQMELELFYNQKITFAISAQISFENIWDGLKQCFDVLNHQMYMGKGVFISFENIKNHQEVLYTGFDEEELEHLIMSYNFDDIIDFINKEYQKIADYKITSNETVRNVSINMKNILLKTIIKTGINVEAVTSKNKDTLSLPDYRYALDYCSWVMNVYSLFLKGLSEFPIKCNVRIIDKAINYINLHYAEKITLESVAAYVNKSRNYFSHLFKNETGMTFVEYVNLVRINEAKKMLDTTSLMIYEISQLVGFLDYKYFSTTFKSIVGCSPKQYKSRKKEA